MIAEIIILVVALLFLIISIFLFNGKGKWLIAGYHTLSKDEQKKYDEKKLCKAVGILCIICCFMLCIMAYLGYRVDSGLMNENDMLPFGLLFVIVIIVTLIIISRYINKKAKK